MDGRVWHREWSIGEKIREGESNGFDWSVLMVCGEAAEVEGIRDGAEAQSPLNSSALSHSPAGGFCTSPFLRWTFVFYFLAVRVA
jgi:hypothetical protein